MSKFEDRLLADLVAEHGPALATAEPPEPQRRHHRPLWITTGVVAVAAGAAVSFTLAGGGSTPAFGLTRNTDGTVTLSFQQLPGIKETNARLAALGLPVRLAPMSAHCTGPAPDAGDQAGALVEPRISGQDQLTIRTNAVPAGDTFVIGIDSTVPASRHEVPSAGAGPNWSGTAWKLVSGPVPACLDDAGRAAAVGFGQVHSG